jgi:N-acetylglutamate synthase-like GNAT family acetyltransferase
MRLVAGRRHARWSTLHEIDTDGVRVRRATRQDIPGIVEVAKTSVLPGEDAGFGGLGSPFDDPATLASEWEEPNVVGGEEILVAEIDGRTVGYVTVEDRGLELELVNINVPLDLQGHGIGTRLVRSVENSANTAKRSAVTLGTSRNAEGVAWKSLEWWQHLGYRITHEEENEWTRSIGRGVREIRMRKDLG